MMEILGTKVSSIFSHDYWKDGSNISVRSLFVSPADPIVIQGVEYFGNIEIWYSTDNGVSVINTYLDLDSFTRSTGKPVRNRKNLNAEGVEYATMTEYAYDLVKNGGDLDRIARDGIRYVKSWITRQENTAKREAQQYLTDAVSSAPENIREQVKALAGL